MIGALVLLYALAGYLTFWIVITDPRFPERRWGVGTAALALAFGAPVLLVSAVLAVSDLIEERRDG